MSENSRPLSLHDGAPGAPLVIAHRATMGHAPENTLRGLRAGLELSVDGIEVDVQLSGDGVPVLLHDHSLDRTTDGSGPLSAMALAELGLLDAGAGERIPTLRQALAAVVPTAVLVIEIKAAAGQPPETVAAAVLRDIHEEGAAERIWLWSFDGALLEALARLAHGLPIAHLCRTLNAEVRQRVRRLGLAGVSMAEVDESLVRELRAEGLETFCWTKNDATELAELVRLPLSGIVSDYPKRVQAARRELRWDEERTEGQLPGQSGH